jgi:hypothetical protein
MTWNIFVLKMEWRERIKKWDTDRYEPGAKREKVQWPPGMYILAGQWPLPCIGVVCT